jgi:hypothetical protein
MRTAAKATIAVLLVPLILGAGQLNSAAAPTATAEETSAAAAQPAATAAASESEATPSAAARSATEVTPSAAPTWTEVTSSAAATTAEPESSSPQASPQPSVTGQSRISIAPRSVPMPDADHIVISVRIGGDRAPDSGTQLEQMNNAQATGVAGVTLYLGSPGRKYSEDDGTVSTAIFTPFPYSWAKCVSDADGDCNFTVPVYPVGTPTAQVPGGADAGGMLVNRKPWVGMSTTAHPAITTPGWHMPYTSIFSNNVNVSQPNAGASFTYLFQLNKVVTAGSTYRSTDNTFAFLKDGNGDATNFVPLQPSATQPGTVVSGGRYMVVRDNPAVQYLPDCALKVALVLDLSSSMSATEVNQAKAAIDGMVTNLTGKSTQLGIFSFNRISPAVQASGLPATNYPGPYPVTTPAQATAFKNLYSTWTAPLSATENYNASTNWDHALTTVANSGVTYDVAVLITDGAPTTLSANPYGTWALASSGYLPNTRALEAGVFSANLLKSKGTRVVPFWVEDVTANGAAIKYSQTNNIRNVSGPTQNSDFYNVTAFSGLSTYLNSFAATCAQSTLNAKINVNKRVQDADGSNERVASGWTLGATATATTGTVTTTPTATTQVTPASGKVTWTATFGTSASRASIAISETQQAGYDFVSGSCTITPASGTVRTVAITSASGVTLTGVAPQDKVDCTFINKPPAPAKITVHKRVQDVNGQNEAAASGWTLGAAISASTGTVTATPSGATQVTPASGAVSWTASFGTPASRASVAISETQQANWMFVSGSCTITTPAGTTTTVPLPNAAGATLSNIAPGYTVDCTFVNKPNPPTTGSVAWQKVNGSQHLAGSVWTITGPGTPGTVTTVADCVSAPCAGPDTDTRPGYLKVIGLAGGAYTLVETKAPAGYVLDATPHAFTIGVAPLQLDWDLGAIENKQQLVPGIPLTGGIGRDDLLIAGGALLLIALSLGAVFRRRAVNRSVLDGRFPQD